MPLRAPRPSRRGTVGNAVAAERSEPEGVADLHGTGGIVELREARLFHDRSGRHGLWVQSHGRPAVVRPRGILGINELSGDKHLAVRRPAQVVGIEIDLHARTL